MLKKLQKLIQDLNISKTTRATVNVNRGLIAHVHVFYDVLHIVLLRLLYKNIPQFPLQKWIV